MKILLIIYDNIHIHVIMKIAIPLPWVGEELELCLLGVLLEDVEFDGYCPALILGSAQNSVNVDMSAFLVEPDEDASGVRRKSK